MRRFFIFFIALFSALICGAASGGKAKHVIVIVWDGMRPDFISAENTPTLFQLAQEGVRFDNHHPVYISATEVNGVAIATGAYPAHDGIIGNREFRPNIDPSKPIRTEEVETVRKADTVTHGHYILVPTLAELLRKAGMKTAIAGAKPVALLHDRAERKDARQGGVLSAGQTLPEDLLNAIVQAQGAFPATNEVLKRNDWTTEALIGPMWKDGVPPFSVLWMNVPDYIQHSFGVGSPQALESIRDADNDLAKVLRALDEKGIRTNTDILLVSDHGFSTVLSLVDLADSLTRAGFNATRKLSSPLANGDVFVGGNGGSVLLYVGGHDPKTIKGVVQFLEGWNYTGVIFTKAAMPGTFALSQIHLDSPTAPDICVSMRWNADKNEAGAPGMLICDLYAYGPGQGMHGSLSAFDMHNTFVANGPDFRSGVVDRLPTGNVDIAPTVLSILGVKRPKSMDGRVVSEAMTGVQSVIKSFEPEHLEATNQLDKVTWHQYLNFTQVNGVDYFDEGNGFQTPR